MLVWMCIPGINPSGSQCTIFFFFFFFFFWCMWFSSFFLCLGSIDLLECVDWSLILNWENFLLLISSLSFFKKCDPKPVLVDSWPIYAPLQTANVLFRIISLFECNFPLLYQPCLVVKSKWLHILKVSCRVSSVFLLLWKKMYDILTRICWIFNSIITLLGALTFSLR